MLLSKSKPAFHIWPIWYETAAPRRDKLWSKLHRLLSLFTLQWCSIKWDSHFSQKSKKPHFMAHNCIMHYKSLFWCELWFSLGWRHRRIFEGASVTWSTFKTKKPNLPHPGAPRISRFAQYCDSIYSNFKQKYVWKTKILPQMVFSALKTVDRKYHTLLLQGIIFSPKNRKNPLL